MKKISNNEQIIVQIEALLIQLKQSLNGQGAITGHYKKNSKLVPKQKLRFSGLTERIYELIEEGYFTKPNTMTIAELQKKLKDRGSNKATTAIMPSLKLLIDKKILDRNKPDKGLYKYFKR